MFAFLILLSATAPQAAPPKPNPKVTIPVGVNADSWNKAARRVENFKFDKSALTVRLFANSDQTQDPTAICFDDQNRLYVAENHRLKRGGVPDNRQRLFWFLDDIASQTVADRLAMYKKWESKFPLSYYTKYSERVITLEDRDDDGTAETRIVYADQFNDPVDGPAIGLIAKEGVVYLTCIPHLWLLEDTDADGVADRRRSLQDGFGVRVSLSGHDMHGLAWGPDGKLYWSIGDRGYNITTQEGRHYKNPASGAVFRCEPDGSDLELFHVGLRNPQELAFDQFGNLFTVDNNADLGDKARVVYLIEGGNTGWHSGTQNLTTFRQQSGIKERNNLVPWMEEKVWGTEHEGQPAYALPPLPGFTIKGRTIVSGPSGLVFHSTGAMGTALANAFYVCDFRGRAARSGIFSFKVATAGAGFKVVEHATFLSGIATPDIEFSYDGKLFIADWAGAWDLNNRGNIYTVENSAALAKSEAKATEQLFKRGFHRAGTTELTKLLAHVDMRVRIRAQYELVKRGAAGRQNLLETALTHRDLLARLHGIWGTGQLGRRDKRHLLGLVTLLADAHPEVRANTLKVLGEARYGDARDQMIQMLKDENLRVRSFAALALGKLEAVEALEPILAMLIANADKDRFLRHAGCYAITQIRAKEFVYENLAHENKSVRLAMLLVLRRWQDPQLKVLLDDGDAYLVAETVRAIHDLPLAEAESDMADTLGSLTDDHTRLTHQRVITANFRLGTQAHAKRLLTYCQKPLRKHERARIEAMHLLSVWDKPPKVDRVVGLIRAYPGKRDDIRAVIDVEVPKLLSVATGQVAAKAVDLALEYDVKLDPNVLVAAALNTGLQIDFRLSCISNLLANNPQLLLEHTNTLAEDKLPAVRAKALEATLQIDKQAGLEYLMQFIRSKNAYSRQAAYQQVTLRADKNSTQSEEINALLVTRLDALMAGKGQKESRLELVEACAQAEDPAVAAKYGEYEAKLASDALAPFAVTLYGGDKVKGKQLVETHGIAQCIRCHRLDHRPSAGPGLRHIGKKDRNYLLRSLIDPNSEIADGFGVVIIETVNGSTVAGTLIKEDKTTITLKIEEKKNQVIKKSDIKSQTKPVSAMIPMGSILSKREIRDIIEFLSSLL